MRTRRVVPPHSTPQVYQANIYKEGAKFYSFKRVLRQLQAGKLPIPTGTDGSTPVCTPAELDQCQLISYHSTSKGLIGECGERGMQSCARILPAHVPSC